SWRGGDDIAHELFRGVLLYFVILKRLRVGLSSGGQPRGKAADDTCGLLGGHTTTRTAANSCGTNQRLVIKSTQRVETACATAANAVISSSVLRHYLGGCRSGITS